MKTQQSISIFLMATVIVLAPALHAASPTFHFSFQRDGACQACSAMPPPGDEGPFEQKAGIDVMFNGFNQSTGQHWDNDNVQTYSVTYTYSLAGKTHSVTQSAPGNAPSITIKPYRVSELNEAQVVSITVTASFATGPVTKTANSPNAFQLY